MSLILALGSNQGNRLKNLETALEILSRKFKLVKKSIVYESEPVDYLDQPTFLNQVIEFALPNLEPEEILKITQNIEIQMGRKKSIPKGPRLIDIDILFYHTKTLKCDHLEIPHPEWQNRAFVFHPLIELPFYKHIKANFPHNIIPREGIRPFINPISC